MKKIFALAALATLMAAQSAQASTIVYNNGAPDQVFGTQMSEFRVAENFTLGASAAINNITFWSVQESASSYTGSVAWAILSDSGGAPGATVQSGLSSVLAGPTGLFTAFNYAEYIFNIPVSFTLGAGNYWLALHNGALANTAPSEMLWETTAVQVGSLGMYFDPNFGWVDSGLEHAFRLDGPDTTPPPGIPEPTTLVLCLSGLAAVAVRRRLFNKHAA